MKDAASALAGATRWRCRDAAPMVLRAWLSAPIAWDSWDGITVEGALQHAVVIRTAGRMPDDLQWPSEGMEIPIPVADVDIAGRPIACASWAQPAWLASEAHRWRRKRARAESYALRSVVVGCGTYKALQIPTPTMVTPWLDFHLEADRALLTDLLRDVGAIGRARGGGLGVVEGWEMLPPMISVGPLVRVVGDGPWLAPMRTLPVSPEHGWSDDAYVEGTFVRRVATTRAPYWLRHSACDCAVPVVRWRSEEVADAA